MRVRSVLFPLQGRDMPATKHTEGQQATLLFNQNRLQQLLLSDVMPQATVCLDLCCVV
jgi:hypothetical protein